MFEHSFIWHLVDLFISGRKKSHTFSHIPSEIESSRNINIFLNSEKKNWKQFEGLLNNGILDFFSDSNAAISDQLLSDENNADTDTDMREKSVADLELMQNRNQHHRILNSIQSIR